MEPTRLDILTKIGDCLGQVRQWARNRRSFDRSAEYFSKAQALIELLEVHDCGSIGGYDKGQPPARDLFDRWDWLYRKFHNPVGQPFCCETTSYEQIEAFFKGVDGV